MKPILPVLKEKNRYVLFEIIGEKVTLSQFTNQFNRASSKFLGDLGLAMANIKIISQKFKNNKGIIKVNNKKVDELKATLMLMKEINGNKIIVNPLNVSGLLNKLEVK